MLSAWSYTGGVNRDLFNSVHQTIRTNYSKMSRYYIFVGRLSRLPFVIRQIRITLSEWQIQKK